MDQESNKAKLFSCAMKGEWKEVIKMYGQDEGLHSARIVPLGHTALHIAVSEGKENVVEEMVDAMLQKQGHNKEELIKALKTPNHRNNTALHLAAFVGNARMCHIIANVEPTLVNDRNVDGETPLFLAALHGRKQAFLCLHSIQNDRNISIPVSDNFRRNNGDTILHCAIYGDYFDLAFQILHLHNELANLVNEEGLSPLHLLASKPCSFRSGSRLGRMETIIYNCIWIDELKEDPTYEHENCPNAAKDSDNHDCPDTYNTLWDFYRLIKKVVIVVGKPFEADAENPRAGVDEGQANPLFPVNYKVCCDLIKFFYLVLWIFLGKGSEELWKIYRKKEIHTWSVQIVNLLLECGPLYAFEGDGSQPQDQEGSSALLQEVKPSSTKDKVLGTNMRTKETPILVAAKNGVMEIIERIVELFPVAILDMNEDKKNMVLLAIEHRQPHVYQLLLKKNIYKESLFHQLDKNGNSALHLAATLGDYKPWFIPGEALQMQWELKWYNFVYRQTPPDFFFRYNYKNETPDVVFTRTHKDLKNRAEEWLIKTSESCSLVAALIATVAFATAATVPGGVVQETGHPTLEEKSQFQLFAISSVIALGCSVTAVVMFLSIMTSRFQEQDFKNSLPRKLLVGLTSLFMSIAAMLVSFCSGHFFVLKDKLHYLALPIYVVTCLPVTLFVLAQFPLYLDILWATLKHVPQRSYKPAA